MKRLAIAALAVLALGAVIAGAQVVTNPAIPPNTVCSYLSSPPTLTNGQASWLRCDNSGALITSSGGGGSTSVTQGTTPWVVGGNGTAGTAASGVLSVQGIASMTPVQVSQGTAANLNATVVGTGTFAVQATTQGATNITLTDCSGTITTGGTAQNAFTANSGRHGFTIANIDTTEVLWISFTTTAAASGTGSYPLGPADATTFSTLSSFTSPPGMGINTALSVVGATTAHKFTCTVW